jgi:endoglucanase
VLRARGPAKPTPASPTVPAPGPTVKPPATDAGSETPVGLYTEDNRIYTADDTPWQGKGANIHDMMSCNACSGLAEWNADEVIRRIDVLVDEWGADFLRFAIESKGTSLPLHDVDYQAELRRIVDHVATKPGVYMMLSLWHDPTFTTQGWPSEDTRTVWRHLAREYAADPHLLFGLVNEPENNHNGELDEVVWETMNETVAVIREVEEEEGVPPHVIAVQGTGGWARLLDYYVQRPIEAGGGENIAYEVHVYDHKSLFDDRFNNPSKTLPVIIGEFGPWEGHMSMDDSAVLMEQADAAGIPWLAWTFHMRCPPNLLVDYSNGGCGLDMPLDPTPGGELFIEALSR